MDGQPNWAETSRLFDEAMALPPAEREPFVARASGDPATSDAVMRLVRAAERETGFLHTRAAGENGDDAVAALSLAPGTVIGSWKIEDRLGAGGMGEVYLARRDDGLYEQTVALKVIRTQDAPARERFEQERQVLARLEHPNIARIIDGGVLDDGRPYMVTEQIEGRDICAYAETRGLDRRERLRLCRQVCAATAHAHARLVLHRDIKPSNVLVTEDGTAKLIDFGVASLIADGEKDAAAPVTLAYAAPEQIRGQPVGVEADIFAIGILMIELLGGDLPKRDLSGRVTLPDTLEGRDLRAILSRATAEAPDQRYDSVAALSNDIQALMERRPVAARDGGRAYRISRFVSRYRAVTAVTLALIVSLIAGLAGSLLFAERAEQSARQAERERDLAVREQRRYMVMQEALQQTFTGHQSDAEDAAARTRLNELAERTITQISEGRPDRWPVAQMLTETLITMNDHERTESLGERLIALAETNPPQDDLLAKLLEDVVQAKIRLGKPDEARPLHARAGEIWAGLEGRENDRLIHRKLTAWIQNAEGETELAVTTLRDVLEERIAYSGETHPETATVLNDLGVYLMRSGKFGESEEALSRSIDVQTELGRGDSVDALNALNNLAIIRHLLGEHETAVEAYERTIELRRSLYGPSASLAALLNNYGKLRLAMEEYGRAAELLGEAADMATRYGGETSPEAIAANAGLAEAHIKQGDLDAAAPIVRDLQAAAEAPGISDSPYAVMAKLARAELVAARGNGDAALTLLDELDPRIAALGPAGQRLGAKAAAIRESVSAD